MTNNMYECQEEADFYEGAKAEAEAEHMKNENLLLTKKEILEAGVKSMDDLVDDFIRANCGNLVAHLIDTDENDGQRLREALEEVLSQKLDAYLQAYKDKLNKEGLGKEDMKLTRHTESVKFREWALEMIGEDTDFKCTCGCDFGDGCLCKERRRGYHQRGKEIRDKINAK